ncbi:MAG: YggS family pyridoxal phosphate-dependent enzyme [Candidatus Cloacimonetes bacterium]|nr:YggS family pyridoxal phosphate-dependent enzyme [Candidatus Cloacimonadota bacterium]
MNLEARIAAVRQRIANAVRDAGREPDSVKLVAVSKTQPPQVLDAALELGLRCLGENKVQEAATKLPLLTRAIPEFHFIGHLQSNKINKLMPLNPALVHSIDKLSTARKLHLWLERHDRTQDVLVQVNTSGEASKSGIEPDETHSFCRQLAELPRLRLRGLMTIGALTTDMERVRDCFRLLAGLRARLFNDGLHMATELSMGMTSDFELAIAEGATIVRIGSAIFGVRQTQ